MNAKKIAAIPVTESTNHGEVAMWLTESWASRLFDLANIGLIFSLAIGVISTGIVVWTGRLKEDYLKNKLGEMSGQTATALVEQEKLKERNLVLQQQLIQLQKDSAARRLSGDQKNELAKFLSGTQSGITIVSVMGDPESSDFADDFDAALKTAKWQTARIKNKISTKFGVAVVTVQGTSRPDAKILSDGLTHIGIRHETTALDQTDNLIKTISPYFQVGYVYLVIERKPLPAPKD